MTRLLVVVPTTGGPALLRRLGPRAGLPVSAAFADGDYRPLPWSADYARLSGAGGPIACALGEDLSPHELRLDRSFDAGRSWETPVAAAHLLIARGFELTDDPASAEVVLWATGAVDLELAIIPGDYAVAEKLELSRALFEAAGSAEIFVGLPPGIDNDADAMVAKWPRVHAVRPASAQDLAEALGRSATSPPPPPCGEGKGGGGSEQSAAVARRASAPSEPLPEPPPPLTPPHKGEGSGKVLRVVFVLACLAIVGGGAALWRLGAPEPAPPPDPVKTDQSAKGGEKNPPEPPWPDPPKPAPEIAIDELRAPAGKTCAQALFGSAAPERRPVAVADGALVPSRLDASLCGVAIRAADPAAASIRVTGALVGASSAPRPDAGGQIYWLKAGMPQNIVYEAQALSKDGAPVGDPVRHELAP